jgi:hypothetical protein
VRLLLPLVFLLSGCGGGGEDAASSTDNHGYGWQFNAEGEKGLRLREPGATPQTASDLERYAGTIAACAGISAPPPFVIVVPRDSLAPHIGWYYSNPPLIVVDEIYRDVSFAHEMVHYLLDQSTGELDADHRSPLFAACAFRL